MEQTKQYTPLMLLISTIDSLIEFHEQMLVQKDSECISQRINDSLGAYKEVRELTVKLLDVEKQVLMRVFIDGQLDTIRSTNNNRELSNVDNYLEINFLYEEINANSI